MEDNRPLTPLPGPGPIPTGGRAAQQRALAPPSADKRSVAVSRSPAGHSETGLDAVQLMGQLPATGPSTSPSQLPIGWIRLGLHRLQGSFNSMDDSSNRIDFLR